MENNFKLALVGINHKSSKIDEREMLQLSRADVLDFLQIIYACEEIDSVIILNTCNRLEFYLSILPGYNPLKIIEKAYSHKNIDLSKFTHLFYSKDNGDITRHLFSVISGLDSLVLGEYQIQGQVKEAYSIACEVRTVNKVMHKLFHAAFRTGKKVRTNTSIAEGRNSVSGVAAQIVIDKIPKDATIAIIGVNENTKIMAEKLRYNSFKNFIFINRTKYKADILAEEFGGLASDLESLETSLLKSSAVFTSTGAKDFIITQDLLQRLVQNNSPLKLLIDMAVPRDIDTKNLPESISSYDIGDLQQYLEEQNKIRMSAVPDAEKIIEDNVSIFQAWSDNQNNTLLEPYSEKFELVRQQLMEEYKQQFSPQTYDKVDKLSKSLIHRLQSTFIRAIIRTNQELKVFIQHRDSM
jgi:glutamyl-tRNA reductase